MTPGLNAPFGAQCFPTLLPPPRTCSTPAVSMHLLVLSAFRHVAADYLNSVRHRLNAPFGAQCFPTERKTEMKTDVAVGLNAPFGAQCFPTRKTSPWHLRMLLTSQCTFWCSVLSDRHPRRFAPRERQVSMHLLVLSAFRHLHVLGRAVGYCRSQCTFWCSVLSDKASNRCSDDAFVGLNAPFGAQCFPTIFGPEPGPPCPSLNAPFGAQCFPTNGYIPVYTDRSSGVSQCTFWCSVLSDRSRCTSGSPHPVSMHLLVLSAFRLKNVRNGDSYQISLNAPFGAQCFPTQVP